MREIYVFYVDVFLIQNFLMDLVALIGANYFLRRHRRWQRLLAVAAFSSLIGLMILLFVENQVLYLFSTHLLLNGGMTFFAFGRSKKREFVENWFVIYVVVTLFGGSFEWMIQNHILTRKTLFFSVIVVFAVYGILFYLMRRKDFKNHILEIQLRNHGKEIALKAYWDSGNQLRDPYTGQGICIISREYANCLFDEKKEHFRLVPYRALGAIDEMLCVTDIEEMIICDRKRKVRIKHVAVGIAEKGLMENCEYQLVLHESFL